MAHTQKNIDQSRMAGIAEKAENLLGGILPFSTVISNDRICSSVTIRGSLHPREEWNNGIYENIPHFTILIFPSQGKLYDKNDPKVVVEVASIDYRISRIKKFRKYTGPVDKVLGKIEKWVREVRGAYNS